jgi:dephospho-CoA kinase
MLRYGLTGGIASGKSVVAAMLREEGFPVVAADQVSHALIERSGGAYAEVVSLFGKAILDAEGNIDRRAVANIVFEDREMLNRLNSIVHPKVEREMLRQFAEFEKTGKYAAAFVEAALVFEAGLDQKLDGVVVAWCLPEQQLARLTERGLSAEEARRRIATQMPVSEKLERATEKIDCSGTLEETRKQVAAVIDELRKRSSAT